VAQDVAADDGVYAYPKTKFGSLVCQPGFTGYSVSQYRKTLALKNISITVRRFKKGGRRNQRLISLPQCKDMRTVYGVEWELIWDSYPGNYYPKH
jgi:hypothetical protein